MTAVFMRIGIIAAVALLLIGCDFRNTPGEDDGRKVHEESWKAIAPYQKVISFRKIDGVNMQRDGVKYYCLQFEATMETG